MKKWFVMRLLDIGEFFVNLAKRLHERIENEENAKKDTGKNYQLNYHNEQLAKRKYELSENKYKLHEFIAKYANTKKDVLFKGNLPMLDELNKIYGVSKLIDFTDFFKHNYYIKPEMLECFHMLLTQTYLYYDAENDKLDMMFLFGMAGLDTDLDNFIVLKSPITDEFVGKMRNINFVVKHNNGGSEEEEEND
jgi:hypothetical protein